MYNKIDFLYFYLNYNIHKLLYLIKMDEEEDTFELTDSNQICDDDDTLVLNEEENEEEFNESEEEEEDEEGDEDIDDIEEEEEENNEDDDFDEDNGEIDISDIYEEVFKVNKNVFNKNRKTDPPPVSKVKKTKKRKNIDYNRNLYETFREKGIEIFKKYTTHKNSEILDKIVYKISSENINANINKPLEKNYMSLARLCVCYLDKSIKSKDLVPILKKVVYRGDWIIPDKWKDEKFRQDQQTNNIENPPLPKSGVVRCPRCLHNPKLQDNENRGKRTDYYQKQTRSSDEPMTVFAYCYDCNYKWKF